MAISAVNGKVLNNVPVYTPGASFLRKPKVIGTIDFSKVKYAPSAAPTPTPKKAGILAVLGSKIKGAGTKIKNGFKNAGSKISGGLKNVGTKLTKTKGGKIGLIAAGIGALLIGAGLLINKLNKKDDNIDAQVPTKPAEPVATEPSEPVAPEPTQPVDADPTQPAATDPTEPTEPTTPGSTATPNPSNQEPANPGVTPALPGEKEGGTWASAIDNKDFEMVCRDASGKTRDIKGKLEIEKDFEKNPDEFTITDNSSGEDHVYKYKKIGVNDEGKPIYECVSMNDKEIITENQYTLEWKDDKTPKLVQHKNQDNYGIGLKYKA